MRIAIKRAFVISFISIFFLLSQQTLSQKNSNTNSIEELAEELVVLTEHYDRLKKETNKVYSALKVEGTMPKENVAYYRGLSKLTEATDLYVEVVGLRAPIVKNYAK